MKVTPQVWKHQFQSRVWRAQVKEFLFNTCLTSRSLVLRLYKIALLDQILKPSSPRFGTCHGQNCFTVAHRSLFRSVFKHLWPPPETFDLTDHYYYSQVRWHKIDTRNHIDSSSLTWADEITTLYKVIHVHWEPQREHHTFLVWGAPLFNHLETGDRKGKPWLP